MKNKVNIHELTRKFNEYRQKHTEETYLYPQLMEVLHSLGFNKNISKSLTKFFDFQKVGCSKVFRFPDDPVYEKQFLTVYNSARESNRKSVKKRHTAPSITNEESKVNSEAEAINFLIEAGKVKVFFDIKRFKEEMPHLYSRYCRYEFV